MFALFFHLFVDFVLSRRSLHFTQNDDDWQTALEVCCWCLAGEFLDENNLISFYTINYEHYHPAHSLFLGLSYKEYGICIIHTSLQSLNLLVKIFSRSLDRWLVALTFCFVCCFILIIFIFSVYSSSLLLYFIHFIIDIYLFIVFLNC